MIQKKIRMLGVLSAMLCCGAVSAQQHEVEMILSEIWINGLTAKSRNPVLLRCHEECVCHRPTATVTETKAYKNMGGSPWATSNVMARVAGITKTNTSVFPEKRGDGFCARMDTRMESVKVLE